MASRSVARYHPAVVVLGFQPEDVLRNLNVFRPFYFAGSEVPLSKPRFVERDGVLAAVNVPTVPPDRLLDVLTGSEGEALLAYERYVAPTHGPGGCTCKAAALLATALADAPNPFL